MLLEIKHSRIAMLATAGWIVTEFFHPVLNVGAIAGHDAAVASGAGYQVFMILHYSHM